MTDINDTVNTAMTGIIGVKLIETTADLIDGKKPKKGKLKKIKTKNNKWI